MINDIIVTQDIVINSIQLFHQPNAYEIDEFLIATIEIMAGAPDTSQFNTYAQYKHATNEWKRNINYDGMTHLSQLLNLSLSE
jgi:hypothetical protein